MDINIQKKLDDDFNLFFPKNTDTTQNRALSVQNVNKSQVNRDIQITCALRPNHYIIGV
jgi:hypothetical protein